MVTVTFQMGSASFMIQEEEPEVLVDKLGRTVLAMTKGKPDDDDDGDETPPAAPPVGGLRGPIIN